MHLTSLPSRSHRVATEGQCAHKRTALKLCWALSVHCPLCSACAPFPLPPRSARCPATGASSSEGSPPSHRGSSHQGPRSSCPSSHLHLQICPREPRLGHHSQRVDAPSISTQHSAGGGPQTAGGALSLQDFCGRQATPGQ